MQRSAQAATATQAMALSSPQVSGCALLSCAPLRCAGPRTSQGRHCFTGDLHIALASPWPLPLSRRLYRMPSVLVAWYRLLIHASQHCGEQEIVL